VTFHRASSIVRVTNHTYITAETVCDLLRQIAALGLKTPITLVMDNARYQHCQLVQNLASELGIELLFLPSYSPNLNLIERLWKFVKKDALNSRHHTNYADFHARIDQNANGRRTPGISESRESISRRIAALLQGRPGKAKRHVVSGEFLQGMSTLAQLCRPEKGTSHQSNDRPTAYNTHHVYNGNKER